MKVLCCLWALNFVLLLSSGCAGALYAQDTTDSTATDTSTAQTKKPKPKPKPKAKPDPFDGRGRPQNLHMGPVRIEGKSFLVDYELPFEGYVYIYLYNSNQDRVGLAAWVKKVGYHTARLSRKYLKLGETYTLTLNYKGQMLQSQFQNGEKPPPEPETPDNNANGNWETEYDPNDWDWGAADDDDSWDYDDASYEDDFNYEEFEDEDYMEVEDDWGGDDIEW